MPGDPAGPSSSDEGPSRGIRGHRGRWHPSGPETENEGPVEPPCAGVWLQGYAGEPTEGERRRRMMRKTGKRVEGKGERGGRSTCGEEAGEVSEQLHWKDKIHHPVTGRSDPSANITKKTSRMHFRLHHYSRESFCFFQLEEFLSPLKSGSHNLPLKKKCSRYHEQGQRSGCTMLRWKIPKAAWGIGLKPARVVE